MACQMERPADNPPERDWEPADCFRLLLVGGAEDQPPAALAAHWADLAGWEIEQVSSVQEACRGRSRYRPHAVLAEVASAEAAQLLRQFPEARQVLWLDECTDPTAAAGFDAAVCAHWWQRARYPASLRARTEVIHPGLTVRDAALPGTRDPYGLALRADEWRTTSELDWLAGLLPGLASSPVRFVVSGRPAPALLDLLAPFSPLITASDRDAQGRAAVSLHAGGHSQPLLEAMAAGCAVVAADREPAREVVRDSVNGALIGDSEQGAARLRTLFTSPDQVRRMVREAQDDLRRDFDPLAAALRCARLLSQGHVDPQRMDRWATGSLPGEWIALHA